MSSFGEIGAGKAYSYGSSLAQKAYVKLEEMIITLELSPGSVMSETILSKQLDIGRTPLRQALQQLSREGLVVILPRRGVLVSEINIKTQLKLIETRQELERLVARLSARRATEIEREQFHCLANSFDLAGQENDDKTFIQLDRQFNNLNLSTSRNPFAANAIGLMSGLSRRFWYIHYKEVGDLPLAARLHAEVARQISCGDEGDAATASDTLMKYLMKFYLATSNPDVG